MKVDYLTRSLLYLPAHKEHLMHNALKSGADMLALDLEDSCQPYENKQLGRDTIIKFLQEGLFDGKKVFPRVNDRESGELLKDVYQLALLGITGFIYPKCTNGQDIYFIGKLLETIEYEKHIPVGYFKLIPLIETTGAVANINEVCESCPERIIAVGFGAEDYMSDLGGRHDDEGNSIFSARAIIANAAKAHGIAPLDIVHMKVHDLEDLEREMAVERCWSIPKKSQFAISVFLHQRNKLNGQKRWSPFLKRLSKKVEALPTKTINLSALQCLRWHMRF